MRIGWEKICGSESEKEFGSTALPDNFNFKMIVAGTEAEPFTLLLHSYFI
jgi:hypothetical protein